MQKGDFLDIILRSDKTIFTLKDIALLWQETSTNTTRVRLNYYVKKGDLFRLRRGVYVKDKNYNKLELATKVFTPSYVSFETVLAQEGLIFQYRSDITVASYLNRNIEIDGQRYSYQKVKDSILINPRGIIQTNNISVATKERAILDTLYSNTDYHFDNTNGVEWEKVFELLPMYQNHRLEKTVKLLVRKAAKDDARHFIAQNYSFSSP
ncbi:MAG: type IV toxin-antitoxin system AbiEi family antitoxin domain-containing protein [Patescibacteria group bacterium]